MKSASLQKSIPRIIALAIASLGLAACGERDATQNAQTEGAQPEKPSIQQPPPRVEPPVENRLKEIWISHIYDSKQLIFNAIHPLGKARDIRLHELQVQWKDGIRTNREKDIIAIGVRYTIYWNGPITKDGFTKLQSIYDAEVERITRTDILATNGITNEDFMEAVGTAVGAGISASMEGQ